MTLVRADAIAIPLRDNSVDLIVTSPPYFALRSYTDGGEHYDGQIGSEPTPQAFLEALWAVTAECRRVLKPSGSMWVNLGDSYAGSGGYNNSAIGAGERGPSSYSKNRRGVSSDGAVARWTEADAAWLAGVIDSDGSMSVRQFSTGEGRSDSFVGWVRIGQMRPEVVHRAAEITGVGRVYQDKRGVWNWHASSQMAGYVLRRIWPWLYIKQRQALAIVELCRHIADTGASGGRKLTHNDLAYRASLREAVQDWNQGRANDLEPPAIPRPSFDAIDPRPKSLHGLPWRYAIGCIDQLDLILRAEVIWSKPNGLPESVTDRVRRSHEQWFMFTKEPRYFAAVDEIRESRSGDVVEPLPQHLPGCPLFGGPLDPLATPGVGRRHEAAAGVQRLDLTDQERSNQRVQDEHITRSEQEHQVGPSGTTVPLLVGGHADLGADGSHLVDDGLVAAVDGEAKMRASVAAVTQGDGTLAVDDSSQPGQVCTCAHTTYHSASLGKLPGSVWTIPSEPLKVPDWLGVDHFAAFPQEWPRRIILGWSPSGICVECGEGRRPVVEKETSGAYEVATADRLGGKRNDEAKHAGRIGSTDATITGYVCDCPESTAPTRPAVVLDPFGGTGTTAMVARALGRFGVSMDLSRDYLRLAQWRVFESGHWMKTVTRTHGQQNDKGEWKRPPKREMVKGTMVKVDDGTARCWECGWSAPTRSVRHGEALARTHGCQS